MTLLSINQLITKLKTILQSDEKTIALYVIWLLATVLILVFIGQLLGLFIDLAHNKRIENNSILLEILPKETAKIKDTEALIRNLHSLLLNTKYRQVLYGRPYMSFEIAASQGVIKFYIKVPKDYKKVIMERVYSTYPEIAIQEASEDHIQDEPWITPSKIFQYIKGWIKYFRNETPDKPKPLINHLKIYGTEMELGYHHIFSIKTGNDKDILKSILSGMKNLEWHERVAVQILARPRDNRWQLRGRRALEKYEKGGKRPTRGTDFANFFNALGEALTDGFEEELDRQGLGMLKSKNSQKKSRMERGEISAASQKLIEAGFETVIRVMAIGHYGKGIKSRVKGITASFNELDKENRFKRDIILNKKLFFLRTKARRIYLVDRDNILTAAELASFFMRLPGAELLDEFQDIVALQVKEFAPPKNVEKQKNVFATNFYRGEITPIGIKDSDLSRHVVVQGITGTGKSEFIKTLILNQVKQGRGLLLLEPHGKLSDEFMELIPSERRKDVVYFDLFDQYPPAFNFCKVFRRPGVSMEDAIEKTADAVIEIFKRNFSAAWSGKNEYYVENGIKTVIELQEGNILDIQRLFSDAEYRNESVKKIRDPQVRQFWETEFAEDSKGNLPKETQSTVRSVMYKLGKFLNSKKMLRAITQNDSIDFKKILDENKILILKFSKEDMTEDRISFLGSIAMKLLVDAAFTRDKKMWGTPFLVAIDEAQNFIDTSIMTILDELRKFGICLFLMHQRRDQMNKVEGLLDAIYNNVGTTITFTVGQPDAPYFEKIYGPRVDSKDLQKLPQRYGYCKLLVDGKKSETFNIYTIDRPEVDRATAKESMHEIKKFNREGRLHYKEIDKVLAERISDYKKLDENGKDEIESFIEDYTEEYQDAEVAKNIKINSTKNAKQACSSKDDESSGFVTLDLGFTFNPEEMEETEELEDDDFAIKITRPYEGYIEEEPEDLYEYIEQHLDEYDPYEELQDAINPDDEFDPGAAIKIENIWIDPPFDAAAGEETSDIAPEMEHEEDNYEVKSIVEIEKPIKRPITLLDLIEEDTESSKIEGNEAQTGKEIKIELHNDDATEEKETIHDDTNIANKFWQQAVEKEIEVMNEKQQDNEESKGRLLWEMASKTEKMKRRR